MAALTPAQVLYDGASPPAILPCCDHYAGSEKLMRKSLALQAELGPVFDITFDCEDGAAVGQEAAHAALVADLLGIGLTRELGPLMTAIMVSGRSGSAIAAEISTMKFTEELDALQTMGLDPLRFVAVPKMWAMLLCMPLLTIMADLLGILGGTLVGLVSMDIPVTTFLNQVFSALFLKDLLTGLVKSISFAWIITIIAVHRGLNFSGGAAGVGQATTSSVVTSLFGIIILDAFWGLVFYLKW
jgi:phospholipid/cholesterol/gamma-HCH transport system permease protein